MKVCFKVGLKYWSFSYFSSIRFYYLNAKRYFIQCKRYCSQWDNVSFPIHILTVPFHIMLVGLLIKNKIFQFKTLPTSDWNVSFLRFETEINLNSSFPKKTVVIIYIYGPFQNKSKQGGWRHRISRGIDEHIEIPGVK